MCEFTWDVYYTSQSAEHWLKLKNHFFPLSDLMIPDHILYKQKVSGRPKIVSQDQVTTCLFFLNC